MLSLYHFFTDQTFLLPKLSVEDVIKEKRLIDIDSRTDEGEFIHY